MDRPRAPTQRSLVSAISGPPRAKRRAIAPRVRLWPSYGTSIFTGGYFAPSEAAASKKLRMSGSRFGGFILPPLTIDVRAVLILSAGDHDLQVDLNQTPLLADRAG